MIYTSYFGKLKKLTSFFPPDKIHSVCLWPPKWYSGTTIPMLFPSAELLKKYKQGLINEEEYAILYNSQLRYIDVHTLATHLDGCVLLCYEKPDSFCHRHLIAEWFRKHGYECEEFIECLFH